MVASKLKKQQRQKRWAGSGLTVPEGYFSEVAALAAEPDAGEAAQQQSSELRRFALLLLALIQQGNTYAEIEALKPLCAYAVHFGTQQKAEDSQQQWQRQADLRRIQELLVELLLLPNSRALHKQMLSSLRPLLEVQQQAQARRKWQPAAGHETTFAAMAAARIAHLAEVQLSSPSSTAVSTEALLLGSALASLLAKATCKPALLHCAVPAVAALAAGIRAVLGPLDSAAASTGAGPEAGIPTDAMEGLQDSISALYFLLSAFGATMLREQPETAAAAVVAAGEALLLALQGQALVREALASAAVALYASAVLPTPVPAAVARCFAAGLLLESVELTGGGLTSIGDDQPLAMLLQVPGEPLAAAAAAAVAAEWAPIGLLDARLQQQDRQQSLGRIGGVGLVAKLRRLPSLSRLCAIRGLLSATPASVLCAPLVAWPPTAAAQPDAPPVAVRQWLLLVHGTLPAIAAAIQNTTDEHFRFHAYSTLCICLEQVRSIQRQAVTAAAGKARAPPRSDREEESGAGKDAMEQQPAQDKLEGGCTAEDAVKPPLLDAEQQRLILQLLWQGFEAPLSQTLHRVVASFDCLLDILQLQQQLEEGARQEAGGTTSGVFLGISRNLLGVDASRKGRYAPVEALIPRVGAAPLLKLQPGLVATCLETMSHHLISASVASMLLALLAQLQLEAGGESTAAANGSGGDGGSSQRRDWRASWLPALVAALRDGGEQLRGNLAAHLLPRLLSQDPAALGLLLKQLLPQGGGAAAAGATAACLAVLKAARKQQLLADLDAVAVQGLEGAAIHDALLAAVRSGSEGMRADALGLVCCHPRTTEPPSELELAVAAEAVRLSLRCSSASMKHKVLAPLGKLLMRQRGAVAAILVRKPPPPGSGAAVIAAKAVVTQQRWLHWLEATLLGSLYPGASHQRSFMALELLSLLLEAFGDLVNPSLAPPVWCKQFAALLPEQFDAFGPRFCTEGTVQLLLAATLDSWEQLREASSAVLLRMPTPLPGFATPATLQPLLRRALCLLACPRGRESDAGAQLLLLLLCKYGGAGGGGTGPCWRLNLSDGTVEAPLPTAASPGANEEQQAEALWCFLSSGCDLLQQRVDLAGDDMLAACRGGLAQGILLALRYAMPHLPWKRLAERRRRDWQHLVARLLELTYAVSDLTLPVLSKPQDQNMDATDVDTDGVVLEEESAAAERDGMVGGGAVDALGPRAQIINTGCWQSSKECGLLLGGLARVLPIEGPAALLDGEQLSRMAAHFTHLLCELKHNGAVDKTQQGFATLCERLLQQGDSTLRQLPHRCLQQLLAFARRPGQGQSDIVRRSAGLPFGVVAIFSSEPLSSQKVLLHRGMAELLSTAGDEEQWPRVHALNCLRMVFQDADLAVDTSAHLAPGMQTAILGMAAPQWEVRNAASLCYTALLVRVLGFRNGAGKGTVTAKRAPTAADFFARHPTLHPFLLRQMAAAAAALDSGSSSSSSAAATGGTDGISMHPSMFPVLVLLSRLRSSKHNRISGGTGSSGLAEEHLSPSAFAPLLQHCVASATLAVRKLAAAALPPLLPPERQPAAAALLAAAVAEAVAAAAAAARAGSQQQQQVQRPSFNTLHGQLLQLRALLEAAAEVGDAAAAGALLAAMAPPLTACAADACSLDCSHTHPSDSRSCLPAAVSLEYIRGAAAAAALLPSVQQQQLAADNSHAAGGAAAAAAWLQEAQWRCWEAVERTAGQAAMHRDYCSPMLSFAFKHATQFCFCLLFQQLQQQQQQGLGAAGPNASTMDGACCSDELVQRLAIALQSSLYEVRGAALKMLLRHVQQVQQEERQVWQQSQQPAWQPAGLRQVLQQQLDRENHHKAQRRLLHLLALLPAATEAGEVAAGGTTQAEMTGAAEAEFTAMLAWASSGTDTRIRQHAVHCLGPLLAQLLCQQGGGILDGSFAAAAASRLLALADECSQPRQLPELRMAAAAAVAASGLLAADPHQSQAAAAAVAGAWAATLHSIEDEEAEVRQVSAAAAASVLAEAGWGSAVVVHCTSGGASRRRSCSAAAVTGTVAAVDSEPAASSEERVLRRAFPALAARFGPHPALLTLHCHLCCPAAAKAAVAGAMAGPPTAVAAERIFDREPDNIHEEPLLLAQLAAGSLAQLLPHVVAGSPAAAHVQAWVAATAQQLQQLAALLEAAAAGQAAAVAAGSGAWATVMYHQQFELLYGAWLALWAAAHLPCSEDSAAWDCRTATVVAQLAGGVVGSAAAANTSPQLDAVAAAAAAAWEQRNDRNGPGSTPCEQLLFLV